MSDCVVVWWEGRGTQDIVQRLADVIATHLDDIESTTKGPVRSKSTGTGSLDNILVEEEQKVDYSYNNDIVLLTMVVDQRIGGCLYLHVDHSREDL